MVYSALSINTHTHTHTHWGFLCCVAFNCLLLGFHDLAGSQCLKETCPVHRKMFVFTASLSFIAVSFFNFLSCSVSFFHSQFLAQIG